MKVLKWLAILFAVVALGVIGVGFVLPDSAHLERSAVIDRPPATVFALVDGWKRFNEWSPWADLDPKTIYTHEGPPIGVGAKYSWASDDPNVGAGSQEILETDPGKRVKVRLIFSDFDTDNVTTYTLVPEGKGTKLTWSYDTVFNGGLMARWFGVMLDSMLGPDYDKGLSRLKALAETLPTTDLSSLDVKVVELKPLPIAFAAGHSTTDAADAHRATAEALAKVNKTLAAASITGNGPPLAITRRWDTDAKVYEFEAGIPLAVSDVTLPDGDVKLGETPDGVTLVVQHRGPATTIPALYDQLAAFKTVTGLEDNGAAWEQFVSDPSTVPEADTVTMIHQPVK